MLYRSRLLLVWWLVVHSGCGAPEEKKNAAPDLTPAHTDSAFADQYFVQDLECQGGRGATDLARVGAYQWQNDEIHLADVSLAGSSTKTLRAGPVAETRFDFFQSVNCQGPSACDDAPSHVIRNSRPLKVCDATKPFPRTSIEGVALASLASLTQADGFYRTLPSKVSLRPATLLVLPTVESLYKDGSPRTVRTDNLAYAPLFGGVPTIIVFPKSAQAVRQGLWKDVNLWEVPWGLAHEFGHHVFRAHTRGVETSTALLSHDSIPIIADPDTTPSGLALAGRTVTKKDLWDAVNEGFADLFAYYALGETAALTQGVDCFAVNRDVGSAVFRDGQAKVLSKQVLAAFASTTAGGGGSCRAPNYQDVHTIGAIVARGVHALFATTTDTAAARAELLVAWGERLGKRAAGNDFQLVDLVEEAWRAAAPEGDVAAAGCQALATAFPEFMTAWRGDGLKCNP